MKEYYYPYWDIRDIFPSWYSFSGRCEKSYYQPSGGACGLVLNKEGVDVKGFLMSHMGSDVGNYNILVDGLCRYDQVCYY
jgi:hypothetical protein